MFKLHTVIRFVTSLKGTFPLQPVFLGAYYHLNYFAELRRDGLNNLLSNTRICCLAWCTSCVRFLRWSMVIQVVTPKSDILVGGWFKGAPVIMWICVWCTAGPCCQIRGKLHVDGEVAVWGFGRPLSTSVFGFAHRSICQTYRRHPPKGNLQDLQDTWPRVDWASCTRRRCYKYKRRRTY